MSTKKGQRQLFIIVRGNEQRIKELIAHHANDLFYFAEKELFNACKTSPNVHLMEIDELEKQQINKHTFDQLKSIAEIPVGDKTFAELFQYHGFGGWYFHRYRIYFATCEIQHLAAKINRVIAHTEMPVVIADSSDAVKLFLPPDLPVSFITSGTAQKKQRDWGYFFKFLLLFSVHFFSGIFKARAFRKRKRIFLGMSTHFSKIGHQGVSTDTNNFYGKILDEAKNKDSGYLDLVAFPKPNGTNPQLPLSTMFKRQGMPSLGTGFITFYYGFFRRSARTHVKDGLAVFKSNYTLLEKLDVCPEHRYMMHLFKNLHTSTRMYLFQYSAFRKLLSGSAVKQIIAIDENNANQRSFLEAARSLHIETIGIQHGSIHYLHPSYIFGPDERKYRPVTDKLFLWGEQFKTLLTTNSCYLPEQCLVIGQPRMDYIFDPHFSEMDNCRDYLPENKRIVLFASQPQQDPNLRKQAALDVMNACADIEDLELVIKLHPNEEKPYYEQIRRELNVRAIVLKNEINLYHLLQRADIVITCFSTVGAEAIFFNKPLVVLDHLEQDVMNYIASGAGIPSKNQETLTRALRGLISGEQKISREAYASYTRDYAYALDGKVAERFWSGILLNGR